MSGFKNHTLLSPLKHGINGDSGADAKNKLRVALLCYAEIKHSDWVKLCYSII